jgi:hypothetical protein
MESNADNIKTILRQLETIKRTVELMYVIVCGKKSKEYQLYKTYIEELSGYDEKSVAEKLENCECSTCDDFEQ